MCRRVITGNPNVACRRGRQFEAALGLPKGAAGVALGRKIASDVALLFSKKSDAEVANSR